MKQLLTAISLILSLYTLNAQSNLLQRIPQKAVYVMTLNPESINSKLSWEKIGDYAFLEEVARMTGPLLMADNSEKMRAALMNPEANGLGLKKNSYAFVQMYEDYEGKNEEFFVSLLFEISSLEQFKALVEGYAGEDALKNIKNQQNYNVLYRPNLIISWQKDHAYITYCMLKPDADADDTEASIRSKQEAFIEQLSYLEESTSLKGNKQFIDWQASANDLGIWMNYEQVMKLSARTYKDQAGSYARQLEQLIPMMLTLYEDMYLGMDLSFEKGALQGNAKTYFRPAIIDLYSDLATAKVNKKLLKCIDGENVVFYTTMAMNVKALYEGFKTMIIERSGPPTGDVIKEFFGIFEILFDEKEIYKMLKGDVVFALNGIRELSVKETTYEYNEEKDTYEPVEVVRKEKTPVFTLAASHSSKKNLMKFIRIGLKTQLAVEVSKNVYEFKLPGQPKFYIQLKKKILIISNDEDFIEKKIKFKPLDKTHKNHINTNFQTVFFSPLNAIKAMTKLEGDAPSTIRDAVNSVNKSVGTLFIHTAKPKKGDRYLSQDMILSLNNSKKNSLKQLLDFVNALYLKTQKGI